MKALKIIGKIIKWYGIITVWLWAIIGVGEALRVQREGDYRISGDVDKKVIDATKKNYKDWWHWAKG